MAGRDHRIIWKKFRFKCPQCAGTALPERKQIRQVRGRAAMSQNGVSHSCDLLQICQALFAGLVLHDQIRSEHANHRDHVCNPRRCQHLNKCATIMEVQEGQYAANEFEWKSCQIQCPVSNRVGTKNYCWVGLTVTFIT